MDKKELIFNMYKEQAVKSEEFRGKIKKKFKLQDREISDIYARIINYQRKMFGCPLINSDFIGTPEEIYHRIDLAKSRRKQKTHNYNENAAHNRKYFYG